MPTVLRNGPYRIYFYSHEPNEPPRVHIDRDNDSCKFWLDPVALTRNLGFSAKYLCAPHRLPTGPAPMASYHNAWPVNNLLITVAIGTLPVFKIR